MTIVEAARGVTGGVDTHLDVHVAAALDPLGALLGTEFGLGDRHANSALWRIVMVRIAHDPATTAYFERKVKGGRSMRDVIRLLKRYVARELYRSLPRG